MTCRSCKSSSTQQLIDFGRQPIIHNLMKTADTNYESYPFSLHYCPTCGLMQVEEPIAPEILYENYFTVSGWKNQPHVPRLTEIMEAIYGLTNKDRILEVGCNDGSFLDYLKSKGYTDLAGIEPTNDASAIALRKGHTVHHTFWNLDFACKFTAASGKYKLVVTRQVLEHIVDLTNFLSAISEALSDQGGLVIEIPDADWNLDYLDYALWEEHVNYFTRDSLRNLLNLHGFRILHCERTLFSGQAMIVYCQKSNRQPEIQRPQNIDQVNRYKDTFPEFQLKLNQYLGEYDKIAVYGCGARSANFVNFLNIAKHIHCFIDDQKEKQNLFVPGCRVPVLSSDRIAESANHLLLGVNTENEAKVIAKRLHGLSNVSWHSILPPSRLLPDFWSAMI